MLQTVCGTTQANRGCPSDFFREIKQETGQMKWRKNTVLPQKTSFPITNLHNGTLKTSAWKTKYTLATKKSEKWGGGGIMYKPKGSI
jgi:hypothetical protein